MTHSDTPLTPAVFYILLALAAHERHGYGIMKQVAIDSNGVVNFGPGTLYGSIKRMLGDRLIEEAKNEVDPLLDDSRRKYYRITDEGLRHLNAELNRMRQAVTTAAQLELTVDQRSA
jgi:DNA-binding PadR family transcriptional regulator